MRVSMVITALVFVGAFAVHAQQAAPKDVQVGPSGRVEHTMTGCLAKGTEANTIRLTDVEKDARNLYQFGEVKTVNIFESTVELEPHVGHKIAITGTAVADKDFKVHKMKVTAIKMVSATCP
jgi:hypothetical protein